MALRKGKNDLIMKNGDALVLGDAECCCGGAGTCECCIGGVNNAAVIVAGVAGYDGLDSCGACGNHNDAFNVPMTNISPCEWGANHSEVIDEDFCGFGTDQFIVIDASFFVTNCPDGVGVPPVVTLTSIVSIYSIHLGTVYSGNLYSKVVEVPAESFPMNCKALMSGYHDRDNAAVNGPCIWPDFIQVEWT